MTQSFNKWHNNNNSWKIKNENFYNNNNNIILIIINLFERTPFDKYKLFAIHNWDVIIIIIIN